MKKYKMVAIDIDGTLLNNDKKILPETKKDIIDTFNKNVIISICTGRGYPAAKRYIDELGLDMPLILYNGACIRMSESSKLILNKTFDEEIAKKVYAIISKNKGTCCFWSNDKLYFNLNNHYTTFYKKLTSIKPNIINDNNLSFKNINKFIWFDKEIELERIQKEVLSSVCGINYFKSQTELLEIVPFGVSKGEALKYLAELYKIDQSEVVAIGDDENDLSMIRYAGFGIAMGNAKNIVKENAQYITLSNQENGVGEAIKKFILCLYPF